MYPRASAAGSILAKSCARILGRVQGPVRCEKSEQRPSFPGGARAKESAADAGDGGLGLIPVLGRSPGVGNGHPLQYSCLENSMVRGAWQATVHRVTKSQT